MLWATFGAAPWIVRHQFFADSRAAHKRPGPCPVPFLWEVFVMFVVKGPNPCPIGVAPGSLQVTKDWRREGLAAPTHVQLGPPQVVKDRGPQSPFC